MSSTGRGGQCLNKHPPRLCHGHTSPCQHSGTVDINCYAQRLMSKTERPENPATKTSLYSLTLLLSYSLTLSTLLHSHLSLTLSLSYTLSLLLSVEASLPLSLSHSHSQPHSQSHSYAHSLTPTLTLPYSPSLSLPLSHCSLFIDGAKVRSVSGS